MAARAIWKGQIKLNSVRVPVRLYSAVQDRTVRFHILEERTMSRVKQHMIDPQTGKEVAGEEIQKSYEVEPGTFVLLTDEELTKLAPKPSRDIEIQHFVPFKNISQELYDRPYYLGPDGDSEAYFALAEALQQQEREGIARWVMRKKRYVGALHAEDDYLMLVTLRDAGEVIAAAQLPRPAGRAPDRKELAMAGQLVGMLESDFDPREFKDEYRNRVMEFIELKAKGKAPRLRAARAKRAPASLTGVLSKSIQQLKKKEKVAA